MYSHYLISNNGVLDKLVCDIEYGTIPSDSIEVYLGNERIPFYEYLDEYGLPKYKLENGKAKVRTDNEKDIKKLLKDRYVEQIDNKTKTMIVEALSSTKDDDTDTTLDLLALIKPIRKSGRDERKKVKAFTTVEELKNYKDER